MLYVVYIVRCRDMSLYCGVTTNLVRRIAEHNGNSHKAAKYTRSRNPVCVVYMEMQKSRNAALKREWEIKKLPKRKKELLVNAYIESWNIR